ncbi:hypothetical protein EVAR_93437_1 [Eumeta japonica]|uniref:Uncharacterized protein n=1 Tax=Eumeta variegata TaxID=151549 RepID=A0A4C1TM90_EUMVA|nr:hypothetical protein EVAR_93437_1 [Eumeta japonica]
MPIAIESQALSSQRPRSSSARRDDVITRKSVVRRQPALADRARLEFRVRNIGRCRTTRPARVAGTKMELLLSVGARVDGPNLIYLRRGNSLSFGCIGARTDQLFKARAVRERERGREREGVRGGETNITVVGAMKSIFDGKQLCEPPGSNWSSLLMNIRNPRGETDPLPVLE